ncbi:TIGR02391 family protein [Aquibium sp. ELW1220]|uniref:TIGR02391 family protein n=1 Tax=Aquibium sp. ELW1220 TaxID=2976766 RepID=UPI0025AF789D|nr:TIGR02391 family protein [Aquibium sp. ELW1220]MDN2580407.1 TIGR02391 family protein [Aquibium sp. ELW1220]
MQELIETVGLELIVQLEPEELAARLLFLISERLARGDRPHVHLGNILNEFDRSTPSSVMSLNIPRADEMKTAVVEAWAWLEAQGLLIPASNSGGDGWRVPSRRAQKIADMTAFRQFQVSRYLAKEILHPRIADKVWSSFLRGEFDVAVFQAMKGVEVYVREASGMGADKVGVVLMQEAFKEDGGPLADMAAERGERRARMQLFCGAIGSYKNAGSHREVNLESATEATELILLANHLMRIVDARAAARSSSQ